MMVVLLRRFIARRVLRNPPVLLRVALLTAAVLFYGTSGFLFFEIGGNPQLSWWDALWYAVVTVTTVGYGDLSPASPAGRFLVAFPLMFFGIGLLGYVLSVAASVLVEAKARELHGMSNHRLSDHLVIFNYPGIAAVDRLLRELRGDPSFNDDTGVVLVDADMPELPPELDKLHVRYVRGNPSREETLERASLRSARYAVVLSKSLEARSDDQNVAITLAIESLSPATHTVVQCVDYTTEELLKKAGCDSVVCLSRFDAHFLANELLDPGEQQVIEELTDTRIGQQICLSGCQGQGTFGEVTRACAAAGHIAIGILREGVTHLNVAADFAVSEGDRIVTIGKTRMGTLALSGGAGADPDGVA